MQNEHKNKRVKLFLSSVLILFSILLISNFVSAITISDCQTVATGGNVTVVGNNCVYTFLSNDSFNLISPNINAKVLVVAGGGAGGGISSVAGGGGGAGGLLYSDSINISSGFYPIIIGLGGISNPATNGQNSSFDGMTAIGGGAGGTSGTFDGQNGGSGGGAGGFTNFGNGTYSQGNNGGFESIATPSGGGGYEENGHNATGSSAGSGGDGICYNSYLGFSGNLSLCVAGGGAGGYTYGGTGGLGGGGNGSSYSSTLAIAGVDGTGGGGGGSSSDSNYGANGGSGVVIISFEYENNENINENISDWSHNATILIQENSGSDLNNYSIYLSVPYETSMKSDFSDLRFVDQNNHELSYWIENETNDVNAKIWVKVSNITANSNSTIYMYYGNPSADSESNFDDAFIYADDFNSDTSADWNLETSSAGGSYDCQVDFGNLNAGKLTFTSNENGNRCGLFPKTEFQRIGQNYTLEVSEFVHSQEGGDTSSAIVLYSPQTYDTFYNGYSSLFTRDSVWAFLDDGSWIYYNGGNGLGELGFLNQNTYQNITAVTINSTTALVTLNAVDYTGTVYGEYSFYSNNDLSGTYGLYSYTSSAGRTPIEYDWFRVRPVVSVAPTLTIQIENNENITVPFNVTLNNPSVDNYTSNSTSVPFYCAIEDAYNILNLSLIIDGNIVYTVTNSTSNQTDLSLSTGITFDDNSTHTWTCQGFSLTESNTAPTQSFSIAVPVIPVNPQSDVSGNAIYQIMNSAGAGLGFFIQIIGIALFPLLILLALVGIIIMLGMAIKKYLIKGGSI